MTELHRYCFKLLKTNAFIRVQVQGDSNMAVQLSIMQKTTKQSSEMLQVRLDEIRIACFHKKTILGKASETRQCRFAIISFGF